METKNSLSPPPLSATEARNAAALYRFYCDYSPSKSVLRCDSRLRSYSILDLKDKKALFQTANALRVAAINSVGAFVLQLGKLTVVVATVLIGMQIMKVQNCSMPLSHSF